MSKKHKFTNKKEAKKIRIKRIRDEFLVRQELNFLKDKEGKDEN